MRGKPSVTFMGKPCKYGHSGLRYAKGGGCVECIKNHQTKFPDRHQQNTEAYRLSGKNPCIYYTKALRLLSQNYSNDPLQCIAIIFGFSYDKVQSDFFEVKMDKIRNRKRAKAFMSQVELTKGE